MTVGARMRARRGYTVIEVTMAVVIVMATMGVTIKVLGWVGTERRAADRRQWAIQEASNVLERIGGETFERVTVERAKALTEESPASRTLPGANWGVEVKDEDGGKSVRGKRVALRLRWKERSGEWGAPVRVTSWIYRAGGPS